MKISLALVGGSSPAASSLFGKDLKTFVLLQLIGGYELNHTTRLILPTTNAVRREQERQTLMKFSDLFSGTKKSFQFEANQINLKN